MSARDFQQLLQADEDLRYLIDIQPQALMRNHAGTPVQELPSYRQAVEAIEAAKDSLNCIPLVR